MRNEIQISTSKFKIKIQILNSKSQVLSASGPNHRKRRLKKSGNDMPAAAAARQETRFFTLLKNEGSGLRSLSMYSVIHTFIQRCKTYMSDKSLRSFQTLDFDFNLHL